MKNPGRIAGLLYVVASIFGVFGLLYVPSRLIVDGNATATANNIAASEMLYRLGIEANLAGQGPCPLQDDAARLFALPHDL